MLTDAPEAPNAVRVTRHDAPHTRRVPLVVFAIRPDHPGQSVMDVVAADLPAELQPESPGGGRVRLLQCLEAVTGRANGEVGRTGHAYGPPAGTG